MINIVFVLWIIRTYQSYLVGYRTYLDKTRRVIKSLVNHRLLLYRYCYCHIMIYRHHQHCSYFTDISPCILAHLQTPLQLIIQVS